MIRRPPRSTRTDTLFPYTTLFRSLRACETDRWLGDFCDPVSLQGCACRAAVIKIDGGRAPIRAGPLQHVQGTRSEEHTSELQSLMRISYAVFCLKKKTYATTKAQGHQTKQLQTSKTI